jgi:hypothetical protein
MQVNFNSLAQCSNTRALAHECCLAHPGHWLGPVAGLGRLGLWAGPKNKKIECRNKNFACLRKNIFLSIYSLISGSGIGKNIY